MILAGIDGCRKGWLVIYHQSGGYHYKVMEQLSQLTTMADQKMRMLIDIPIGLTSENFTRTLEGAMRKELASRSATVFNAPVRQAVYATTKEEARARNRALTGKSLSEQSLNISPKIREADVFINHAAHKEIILLESHPEICFKYLAGRVILSRKATLGGIEERLAILRRYDDQVETIYKQILKETLRKDVKRDDIVDALCLCVVNILGKDDGLKYLTDKNEVDAQGNLVRIAYFDPAYT